MGSFNSLLTLLLQVQAAQIDLWTRWTCSFSTAGQFVGLFVFKDVLAFVNPLYCLAQCSSILLWQFFLDMPLDSHMQKHLRSKPYSYLLCSTELANLLLSCRAVQLQWWRMQQQSQRLWLLCGKIVSTLGSGYGTMTMQESCAFGRPKSSLAIPQWLALPWTAMHFVYLLSTGAHSRPLLSPRLCECSRRRPARSQSTMTLYLLCFLCMIIHAPLKYQLKGANILAWRDWLYFNLLSALKGLQPSVLGCVAKGWWASAYGCLGTQETVHIRVQEVRMWQSVQWEPGEKRASALHNKTTCSLYNTCLLWGWICNSLYIPNWVHSMFHVSHVQSICACVRVDVLCVSFLFAFGRASN